MEQIILKANINECTVENWHSNAGEVNARVMNVEMCEDLRSCDKQFVTFELEDGTVYESLVVDGKAELPFIERPQFVKIGLYAEDTQGDKCEKRFSSKPAYEYINMGSYTDNVSDNVKPTPGDYSELLEKIENIENTGGGGSGGDELITTERIANDAVTIDKVEPKFFREGLNLMTTDDIELVGTIRYPSKALNITATLKNKATTINKDTSDEAIPTAKAVYDLYKSIEPSGGGSNDEEWVEILDTPLTEDVAYVDFVAPDGKMFKKLNIHINTEKCGLTTASKVIIKGSKSGNFSGSNGEILVSTQSTINTHSNTVFVIEKGSLFPFAYSSMGAPNGSTVSAVYMGGVTQLLSTNAEVKYNNAGAWKTIRVSLQTADALFKTGVLIKVWGVYE